MQPLQRSLLIATKETLRILCEFSERNRTSFFHQQFMANRTALRVRAYAFYKAGSYRVLKLATGVRKQVINDR